MKPETYYGYYAAKFARERKDKPTNWFIKALPNNQFELRCIGG